MKLEFICRAAVAGKSRGMRGRKRETMGDSMIDARLHEWAKLFDRHIGFVDGRSVRASNPAHVGVIPCALVYIDPQGIGSPNCTNADPFGYVEQAITLNRSLLAAGIPALTIGTNAREQIERRLANLDEGVRPKLLTLNSSLTLPKTTRFYAAHFKLDLLQQMGNSLPEGMLALLLDTDMVALRPFDQDVLQRCYRCGTGAFDISDQEFFAYNAERVVSDLEMVAGKPLDNPRWFGGECLFASASFIAELVPRARECFNRYRLVTDLLNHNGDEAFISAALNLLADDGHQIIDVGAYRVVGRHWSGNTHRDLRWFKHCSLLHLPDRKRMLERQARTRIFNVDHVWRQLVVAHMIGLAKVPVRRLIRTKLHAWRQRGDVCNPGRADGRVSRRQRHDGSFPGCVRTDALRDDNDARD
jgi:hypothetical protein